MSTSDNMDFEKHSEEARKKWGTTDAYREYEEKAKGYSKKKLRDAAAGLDSIMAKFALCAKDGYKPDSKEAGELVRELQSYICENFYTCTNEILCGLGQMYVSDERFKKNIDRHGEGTAEFISTAIGICCKK